MTNPPNSDKSGRAQRRRAERAIAKAPAPGQPEAAGIPVSINYLKAKIGELTIEVDYRKEQVVTLKAEVASLHIELAASVQPEETEGEKEGLEEQPSEDFGDSPQQGE